MIEAALALGSAALAWASLVEPRRLVLRRHAIRSARWPAARPRLRIGVLSDLHAAWPHVTAARIAGIARRLAALAPDLVLLPGDFVCTRTPGLRPLALDDIARALEALPRRAPTLAVLGNHDHEIGRRRMRAALEPRGIRVLVNEVARVPLPGGTLQVAGLDCLRSGLADPARTFAALDAREPALLLSHVPDIFPAVPEGVLLTVTGHTHGGQVRLPGLPAPVTMSRLPRRMARGLHRDGERYLYVSAGVGSTGLPLRFGVPPEIALLELAGA